MSVGDAICVVYMGEEYFSVYFSHEQVPVAMEFLYLYRYRPPWDNLGSMMGYSSLATEQCGTKRKR